MLSRFLSQLSQAVLKLESSMYFLLRGDHWQNELHTQTEESLGSLGEPPFITSLSNHEHDSLLWAVPKKRRSVEKRLNRKFGWPHQVWQPLVPKKNLFICNSCGEHFEAGFLCPKCYSKVKKETEELHAAIEKEIGLDPIDKEVVICYEEEKEGYANDDFKGKQIVEITKKQPQWFSKNLLKKTSKGLASTSNVKLSDLA